MSDTAVGVAVGVKDGLVLVVDDCVNKSGTEDCVVWTAMLVDVGVLVVGVTSVVNKGVVSVARAGVVGSGVVGPGVVGSGVVRGVVRKTSVLAAGSVVANGSGALVMSCRLSRSNRHLGNTPITPGAIENKVKIGTQERMRARKDGVTEPYEREAGSI